MSKRTLKICHSCGFARRCEPYKGVMLCNRCVKEAEEDSKEQIGGAKEVGREVFYNNEEKKKALQSAIDSLKLIQLNVDTAPTKIWIWSQDEVDALNKTIDTLEDCLEEAPEIVGKIDLGRL